MTKWTAIPRDQRYEVSMSGMVRSVKTKRVLRSRLLPSGYHRVSLGAGDDSYVHHLVLEAFVGPRPCGTEASHKNGKKHDNRLSNLAWETPSQNNRRKNKHGTALFGERNPMGRKTQCKRGHPFTEGNTRRANGKRICRTCARDHMRRRRAASAAV